MGPIYLNIYVIDSYVNGKASNISCCDLWVDYKKKSLGFVGWILFNSITAFNTSLFQSLIIILSKKLYKLSKLILFSKKKFDFVKRCNKIVLLNSKTKQDFWDLYIYMWTRGF